MKRPTLQERLAQGQQNWNAAPQQQPRRRPTIADYFANPEAHPEITNAGEHLRFRATENPVQRSTALDQIEPLRQLHSLNPGNTADFQTAQRTVPFSQAAAEAAPSGMDRFRAVGRGGPEDAPEELPGRAPGAQWDGARVSIEPESAPESPKSFAPGMFNPNKEWSVARRAGEINAPTDEAVRAWMQQRGGRR
jgi:hypothetical protein